jgi:hypothetical protein
VRARDEAGQLQELLLLPSQSGAQVPELHVLRLEPLLLLLDGVDEQDAQVRVLDPFDLALVVVVGARA